MKSKDLGKKPGNPLETIAVLAFVFTLVGVVLDVTWMPYVVLGLLFIGVFTKGISRYIAEWWMRFAMFLGNVNSKILLSIVFFVFLTPLACIYRLVKGDTMSIKQRSSSLTYWHERNHRFTQDDFEKMF